MSETFVLFFKVVNDRWGSGDECKHGDFYTCHDSYNPGYLIKHKWENCFTVIDKFCELI